MVTGENEKLLCETAYCGLLESFEHCEITGHNFYFLTTILGYFPLEQSNYCTCQTPTATITNGKQLPRALIKVMSVFY